MNPELQTWTWTKESTFPSDLGTAHNLIGEVMEVVRAHCWNDKDAFAIELALEESLSNAVRHGNKSDPSKNIRFDCKLNQNMVYVRIEDEGSGFDPNGIADPREMENQMNESGRGVLLIKHFVTRVQWNDRGNVVEFERERS